MSLIVAKSIKNRITIVGDTKLTYPTDRYISSNSRQTRNTSLPRDGVIKTTLINPQICLSFAGDVELAEQALRKVRTLGYNVEQILSQLVSVNKKSENNTQFILAVSFPLYKLFEIKDLSWVETKNSWIGSQNGFNVFQSNFLENKKARDEKSKMSIAFDAVINDSLVKEVNGFKIQINCNKQFFEYQSYLQSYMANKTSKVKFPSGSTQAIIPITHGSAVDGGYTVNVFLNQDNINCLAIHILQGEFGVVYKSDGGLMRPELIMKNELDFVDFVKSEYQLTPIGTTTQGDRYYFNKGNEEFEFKRFGKAINLYNKSLAYCTSDKFRSKVLLNKGLALLNIGKKSEGLNILQDSIQLEPRNQQQILRILTQRGK